ncbi:MAG TPA: glycoside hydrolase family 97 C-terminal domain-containing protein [Puia sp.]|jgi:alpha-glucosidase
MELLGSVPTTSDETSILDGKVGEYIVTAGKNKGNWFVGALTDWSARDISLNFDFLDQGTYKMTLCKDGVNADRYAADYLLTDSPVKKGDLIKIHLAPGGGFLLRLERQ